MTSQIAMPAASDRIVLVHSLAMDRGFWRPVADRLAKSAAVLVLEVRRGNMILLIPLR